MRMVELSTAIALAIVHVTLAVHPLYGQVGPFDNAPAASQIFPNYAQKLVDQESSAHPNVLVVAFHAKIPGDSINRVVAINRAQWEKFQWRPSDDIDTDTVISQKTIVQVIPKTHRMEVHMPLRISDGNTVATLVCVWSIKDEEEAPDLMKKSQSIRDEIALQTTSLAQLLGQP